MTDKPPSKYDWLDKAILIVSFLVACMLWMVLFEMAFSENEPMELPDWGRYSIIQNNSIMPMSSLTTIEPLVLADKQEIVMIQDNTIVGMSNLAEEQEISPLLERIIFCESGGDPTALNPTSGAYGLCQFLLSTRAYVEKKWNLKIDWTNQEQQLYACQRLLSEEGSSHWEASKGCWKHI